MFMSQHQKEGQNHNIKTDIKNPLNMWQSSNIWEW